jgi:methyl-accepting chemotaxis protein
MFRNLRIANKLTAGFGLVIVLGLAVGGLALLQMRRAGDDVQAIERNWLPSIIALADIRNAANTLRRYQIAGVLATDPPYKAQLLAKTAELGGAFPDVLEKYQAVLDSDEDRHNFTSYLDRWSAYEVVWKETSTLMAAGKAKDGEVLFRGKGLELYNLAEAELNQLVDRHMKGGLAATSDTRALFSVATFWIGILLTVSVVVGVGSAWYITRTITIPIGKTTLVLESVAKGDLTNSLEISSHDELGRMAAALNTTVSAIRTSMAEIQDAARREKAQAEELSKKVDSMLTVVGAAAEGDLTRQVTVTGDDAIGQMGTALSTLFDDLGGSIGAIALNAHALASSSEELAAVSQQMGANAEETSAQAGVVSAASEQVSRNVQTVATSADEMSASVKEIAKNASEAARVAQSAVKVAEATNATITKLGESSAEIGQVVKVITSIAQQTNLLALNATIEAARAGEAGKGFAVVANEVKELAKETAKATEDISRKIEAIQADTTGAVQAIGQIGDVINQINDISNTIASAVEEQTATTNEIGRNVAEAAKGSAEIAQNIAGVAQTARNTTEGANDTRVSAQALAKMAAELQMLVVRFKVAGTQERDKPGSFRAAA